VARSSTGKLDVCNMLDVAARCFFERLDDCVCSIRVVYVALSNRMIVYDSL
jgi:hypothetical protein